MSSHDAPRAVLDTNVLVAAGFRPRSASGRLAAAVRDGRLLALWTEATRAEAVSVLGRIPPLRPADLGALFPEAGQVQLLLDSDRFDRVPGPADRTFAALASAAGAPLVTADAPLAEGARAHGVDVRAPSEAARSLL
ncbi:PIN domain-containing protein [Rubrivirga marina]|uniref:PIN domain-containing protein n=1 Tax=Rubrivirga marina TaxID=1196024 RepID=A0A271J2J3_9BACT|nr:PIN domain-containing protein [Rubrivirga marina]PAP77712.1 hypothetical protein BSZ37_15300 [Rubrivirga marina]